MGLQVFLGDIELCVALAVKTSQARAWDSWPHRLGAALRGAPRPSAAEEQQFPPETVTPFRGDGPRQPMRWAVSVVTLGPATRGHCAGFLAWSFDQAYR